MANIWLPMTIIIAIILIAFLAMFLTRLRKEKIKPNYRIFFILGLVFLPMGIIQLVNDTEPFFFILSMVYLAIGLVNKGKWNQPQEVTEKQKKILMISVLLGILFLLLGIIVFFLIK